MPVSNPMVPQGTLNRLRGSVNIAASPELNVTAPFLGDAGIAFTLQGEATDYIPTMTGAVTSAAPFLMCEVVVNLLKTQGLADQYKKRMEANSLLGDVTVIGDASTLSTYVMNNCSIASVGALTFNGKDAGYGVTIRGYYQVNNDAWGL